MKLKEEGRDARTDFDTEVESVFNRRYLASLSGPPPFVRLEGEYFFNQFPPILISVGMHRHDQQCTDLLEVTANALSWGVCAHMLVAIQHDTLKLSIRQQGGRGKKIRAFFLELPSGRRLSQYVIGHLFR